ncbi:Streptomycin adenylyltransferase [Vibrio crassostreae]|uniref:hypothetical protein n=1 Tax=Vibrio crassostreae TaxID=246167 RepID=UPI001C0FA2F5|nr:hypothetical protein [Vibrio crassostreae]CAK2140707.1 Streptomycin adenylyltransferase [Vibrio crassostreae]CAK2149303.1 Streptomycin adenylyltransferase [Vibrio crassostreae]CAK2165022.1 Streptomycin adenylyltransferase [Vibrio crassostreae]CAK2169518.1 Streptomycin adenylyltransferase [Vibrio crassostreae]CAK2171611.1 Streptomycin adenylyltransferase [Vibrio crassostreae]
MQTDKTIQLDKEVATLQPNTLSPNTPEKLLQRLDAIGESLKASGKAHALLGLGSVGIETERLDRYSDVDFFAIVQTGHKQYFLDSLHWLSDILPIDYAIRNTIDGYKVLYADGIFCEFAVFEPHELAHIPFAEGRIVWQEADFDTQCCIPPQKTAVEANSQDWIIGEALTNLYVGMSRYNRGEKLSGSRFVQSYALDRLIDLVDQTESSQPEFVDEFMFDRRLEARFPKFAQLLPTFTQGYERTAESALAQLEFLNAHFNVNQAMRSRIIDLCN